MVRRLLLFCSIAVAVMLLVGGGWFGAQQLGGQAHAEENWQVKTFVPSSVNNGAMTSNPDRFIDDWIRQLPGHCDIVPVESTLLVIAYRCP